MSLREVMVAAENKRIAVSRTSDCELMRLLLSRGRFGSGAGCRQELDGRADAGCRNTVPGKRIANDIAFRTSGRSEDRRSCDALLGEIAIALRFNREGSDAGCCRGDDESLPSWRTRRSCHGHVELGENTGPPNERPY